jgi:hypothetical protein
VQKDHNIGFQENCKFFLKIGENWRKLAKIGENWRKLAKILIITLTPGPAGRQ